MKNALVLSVLIVGLIFATIAIAKTETGSNVTGSVVLYGKNGTTLVPIKTDVDGSVYLK